ncbi:phospho-sugar mutase [Bacillus shivajii]|uniref:phospho-sugar mutase n=1 Tax=Bacillus shivajii TaxID=1983719 RepID=UPI001CF9C56F|nr:phospho-sugar mutase [Bacillus shivajii]UCZ52407.1 phospho-sugar mutase [Bacillus shivajii]
MQWKEEFERWKNNPNIDVNTKDELASLTSEELIEESFYKDLEFGTGGMRGETGPGTNRMNRYTVRKATTGLAEMVKRKGQEACEKGVAIAYDVRHYSREFAEEAARTLAYHGIRVYLFTSIQPTPVLSFAVRYYNTQAGIVITASHNPPEYNGYKVYGEDGAQLTPEPAKELIEDIVKIEDELSLPIATEDRLEDIEKITFIGDEVLSSYQDHLSSVIIDEKLVEEHGDNLSVVFTPLHGTSYESVTYALKNNGFKNLHLVEEQVDADPEFSTVASPNPEEHAAFELALQYGEKVNGDILIGTDPDADRLGIAAINNEGKYQVLTGNQTGALLLHYLLSTRKSLGTLPSNGVMLTTIVSSDIGEEIAKSFGVETVKTLTGFKFIGEKIKEYEHSGEATFLFGYEESYGYLARPFVRDKDAVQIALMACEVAAAWKAKGKTLFEGLKDIYEEYGYYQEHLESMTLKGKKGVEQITTMMENLRTKPLRQLAGMPITHMEDYQAGVRIHTENGAEEKLTLPLANVVKYTFENGWVCFRPSGTEPKMKVYFSLKAATDEEGKKQLEKLKDEVLASLQV